MVTVVTSTLLDSCIVTNKQTVEYFIIHHVLVKQAVVLIKRSVFNN